MPGIGGARPHTLRAEPELIGLAVLARVRAEPDLTAAKGRARAHQRRPHSSSSPPPQAGTGELGHACSFLLSVGTPSSSPLMDLTGA